MNTEIELKFSLTEQAEHHFRDWIAHIKPLSHEQHFIENYYYDTPDNWLRHHDLGLRIRQINQYCEMTLKGKNKGIAGLQQRMEYNIPLDDTRLQLSLLPSECWPAETDLLALQQHIGILFSTQFQRETWLVNCQSSQIEIALDSGSVTTQTQQLPIKEIELELKQGNTQDLFTFAEQLVQLNGFRLVSQSKAARGYQLLQPLSTQTEVTFTPSFFIAPARAKIGEAIQQMLMETFNTWQQSEELYYKDPTHAKIYSQHVHYAIRRLRQIIRLMGHFISRQASKTIRPCLDSLADFMADNNHPAYDLSLYQTEKLQIMTWIFHQQWQASLDSKQQIQLQQGFKKFAHTQLGRSHAQLRDALAHKSTLLDFEQQVPRLQREIENFYLLSGANQHSAELFIAQWQQVLQAITASQTTISKITQYYKHAIKQPKFWLA